MDYSKTIQMDICHSMILISGTQVESDTCYLLIKNKKGKSFEKNLFY